MTGATLPPLTAAFRAWNDAGIRWCLLREPSKRNGDVDILVHHAHLARAASVLRSVGFTEWPAEFIEGDAHYIQYHRQAEAWIWLHVTTKIAFGKYHIFETGLAQKCLQRSFPQESVVRLDPADEFWIVLLHCLLDKTSVPDARWLQLRRLAGSNIHASPLAQFVRERIARPHVQRDLALAVQQERRADIEAQIRVMTGAVYRGWRVQVRLLLQRFRVVSKLRQALHRRGIVIAVSGRDKACAAAIKALREKFLFNVCLAPVAISRERRSALGVVWTCLARMLTFRCAIVIFKIDPACSLAWPFEAVLQLTADRETSGADAVQWAWQNLAATWVRRGAALEARSVAPRPEAAQRCVSPSNSSTGVTSAKRL